MRTLVVLAALAVLASGAPTNKRRRQLPTVPPRVPVAPVKIQIQVPTPVQPAPPQIQQPQVVVVQAPQQEPIDANNIASESTAIGSASISTNGNARSAVSGGTQATQSIPSQRTDAILKLSLESQEEGDVTAAGRSDSRTDVASAGFSEGSSSQTDALTNVFSSGQAQGAIDANAAGATTGAATRTDADSGSSSASRGDGEAQGASQSIGTGGFGIAGSGEQSDAGGSSTSTAESFGDAGTKTVGRGRAVSTGGQDTTAAAGAQTGVNTIGDGAGTSQETSLSSGISVGDGVGQAVSSDSSTVGAVQTFGPGAEALGEGTGQSTAERDGLQTSKSTTSNQLNSAGDGAAVAETGSIGASALSLDDIGAPNTRTQAAAEGFQSSTGNANSRSNTVGEGTVLTPLGGSTSDATFGGVTAGDGSIEGSILTQGGNRLDLALPASLPGLGDSSKAKSVLEQIAGGPRQPSDLSNPKNPTSFKG